MLREDGYSLTTAQGGREVRGPSIEGIQQKIRDHRYTTFRDCEVSKLRFYRRQKLSSPTSHVGLWHIQHILWRYRTSFAPWCPTSPAASPWRCCTRRRASGCSNGSPSWQSTQYTRHWRRRSPGEVGEEGPKVTRPQYKQGGQTFISGNRFAHAMDSGDAGLYQ